MNPSRTAFRTGSDNSNKIPRYLKDSLHLVSSDLRFCLATARLAAGMDDAFLAFVDPGSGSVIGGWQFGGTTSERLYSLRVDQGSGDVIVGGYTTSALFALNGGCCMHTLPIRYVAGHVLQETTLSSDWFFVLSSSTAVLPSCCTCRTKPRLASARSLSNLHIRRVPRLLISFDRGRKLPCENSTASDLRMIFVGGSPEMHVLFDCAVSTHAA